MPYHFPPTAPHTLSKSEGEYILNTHSRLRRALNISSSDVVGDRRPGFGRDWCLTLSGEHTPRLVIFPKINFRRNENKGCVLAKVGDFGEPLQSQTRRSARRSKQCQNNLNEIKISVAYLVLYVSETGRKVYRKDNENDVAFWVTEGSQSIIFLLTSCIPKRQLHYFPFKRYLRDIVFNDSRDIGL